MTDRPILFSTPMVKALLAGTKTQTRRIVKQAPMGCMHLTWHEGPKKGQPRSIMDWPLSGIEEQDGRFFLDVQSDVDDAKRTEIRCPYGAPGDRLWVREAWAPFEFAYESIRPSDLPQDARIVYLADQERRLSGDKYRPSIFMPRWASRITLTVTEIRVERLQGISEEDAIAEGAPLYVPGHGPVTRSEINFDPGYLMYGRYRLGFEHLWDTINGETHPWKSNPWVWVVEFRR